MNLFFSEKDISDKDIKQIIRPNKQIYSKNDLGPTNKIIKGTMMIRTDFQAENIRQEKLQCSLYVPQNQQDSKLIVIYLHGNSGCRLEANPIISNLIPQGYHVCSYDSSGCGLSEGTYITYGINEKDDLHCIINNLKQQFGYSSFILWGRSMGAVTCFLYCLQMQGMLIQAGGQVNNINGIVGLIIDSAFSNFENLMKEIAEKKISSFLVNIGIKHLRSKLKNNLNGIDLFDIDLIHKVKKLKLPVIFTYSEEDTLILPHHTKILYENYGGPKQKTQFKGDHNSMHDSEYYFSILSFINNYLQHYNFSNQTLDNIEDYIFNKLKQPSKQNLASPNSLNQINNSQSNQHIKNQISKQNFNKISQGSQSYRQQSIQDINKQSYPQQVNSQRIINNQYSENQISSDKVKTQGNDIPFYSPSTSPFTNFKSLVQSVQSLSHQPIPNKTGSFSLTKNELTNYQQQQQIDNKNLYQFQPLSNKEQSQQSYQKEQFLSMPEQYQKKVQQNQFITQQFSNDLEQYLKNKQSMPSQDLNSNFTNFLNNTRNQNFDSQNYQNKFSLQASSSNSPLLMPNSNTPQNFQSSTDNFTTFKNNQEKSKNPYSLISPYAISGQVKIPERQDNKVPLKRGQTSFYNDSLHLSIDNSQNIINRAKSMSVQQSNNNKPGSFYLSQIPEYKCYFPKEPTNHQIIDRIKLK